MVLTGSILIFGNDLDGMTKHGVRRETIFFHRIILRRMSHEEKKIRKIESKNETTLRLNKDYNSGTFKIINI